MVRGCVLLCCTLVLVAHGSAEDAGGSVKLLDPEVREFFEDTQELLQQTPNELASQATTAHIAKLEAEAKAQDTQLNLNTVNEASDTATKKAIQTADPADAEKAAAAKDTVATAQAAHTQATTAVSVAQETANKALKAAQDAGVNVDLPAALPTPPQGAPGQPGQKPLPVELAQPPPAIKPAPPPSKLETLLKDRRMARLKKEAKELMTRYEENKVEHQQAAFQLTQAMTKLAKVKRKMAEAQSAMTAARKESGDIEKKLSIGTNEEHDAMHELESVKHDAKLAATFVDEAKVEEQVASSLAETGGGDEDLEESQAKRDDVNERLKTAKAEIVARKLSLEKARAAERSAEEAFLAKKDKIKELHLLLQKADRRYADAKYEHHVEEHDEMIATEDRDQRKAEEANALKALKITHGLASAAAMKASNSANAEEAHMRALIEDPEEYAKEEAARARDQDGISEKGEFLVSPDGAISQQYISKFDSMPLPDNGRNPILEAEARASLKDDSSDATAPGSAVSAGIQ